MITGETGEQSEAQKWLWCVMGYEAHDRLQTLQLQHYRG